MHVSPSVSSYMATGLRTACRLDQGNLMRIAAEVRKLVSISAAEVHTWMTNPDNIRWGLYHVPKLRTVKDFNTRHSLSLTGRSVNSAASLFEWRAAESCCGKNQKPIFLQETSRRKVGILRRVYALPLRSASDSLDPIRRNHADAPSPQAY